jgi:hypothetical protein
MLLIIIFIELPFKVAELDGVTVEVDLPPTGKIIVRNNSANKLYYKMWAEHYTNNEEYYYVDKDGNKKKFPFTASLVTFNYTNVEEKYDNFLKNYKPSKLLKDRRIYQSFIKNIKVKMISQKFDVEEIIPHLYNNGKEAKVVINGVAHQYAASTKIGDKQCSYNITFQRIGGKIYATSLNTNCF